MSLGNDEKKFLELRAKFVTELNKIDLEIDQLTDRKSELLGILDGYMGTGPEEEDRITDPNNLDLDHQLSEFIRKNGPVKRAQINEFAEDLSVTPDGIRRALERCKRRGLIKVKGRSRAAVWTAVK